MITQKAIVTFQHHHMKQRIWSNQQEQASPMLKHFFVALIHYIISVFSCVFGFAQAILLYVFWSQPVTQLVPTSWAGPNEANSTAAKHATNITTLHFARCYPSLKVPHVCPTLRMSVCLHTTTLSSRPSACINTSPHKIVSL